MLDEGDGWRKVISPIAWFVTLLYVSARLMIWTELNHEWHKIRLVLAEMIHFIRQMEAYCRLEVIECSWKVLIDFLQKKEGDLDALIGAHRTYLDRMTQKILLRNSKPGKEELLLRQLAEIFNTILQFREATVNKSSPSLLFYFWLNF